MADPVQTTTPAPPDLRDGFTPEEAEAVIRRAVRIHEQTADAVAIDELKATVASLGVSPESVELAAGELEAEVRASEAFRKPSDLVMPLVGAMLGGMPGAALVVYRDDIAAIPAWAAAGTGILWMGMFFWEYCRKVVSWWTGRRLRERIQGNRAG
jgi:hypothetical protein